MNKIWALALTVALIGTVASATEVYSQNAVGFVRVDVQGGSYTLVGLPFNQVGGDGIATVADILGNDGIPDMSTVLLWDGSSYVAATFYDLPDQPEWHGWNPADLEVSRASGMWLRAPEDHTFFIMGEVPDTNTTVQLHAGYQMLTFPYPVETHVTNTALIAAQDMDSILKWDGSEYVGYTYYDIPDDPENSGWWGPGGTRDLTFVPAEGFWYRSQQDADWHEELPYKWPAIEDEDEE